MPHTVVLSGQTSVKRISALHAKHFISAPGPPVADALMRPTVRPSEVTPYRCGSLLGRASEPLRPPMVASRKAQDRCARCFVKHFKDLEHLSGAKQKKARGDFGEVVSPQSILRAPPHRCGRLSSRPRWEKGQCWHYVDQPLLLPPQRSTETLAAVRRGKSRSCRRVACRPKGDHFVWLCRSQTY